MADIAQLGFKIETFDLERGEIVLRRFANAANVAEKAATGTVAANDNAAAAAKRNAAAQKQLENATRAAAFQQKMLLFQLNDIGVSLASGMNPLMVLVQQGSQISQIYAGQGGVVQAFKETGKMAGNAAASVGRLALANPVAAAGALALAGGLFNVTRELQKAGHEAITFGDVFVAAMQVSAEGIYNVFKPAIDATAGAVGTAWDWISEKTKWISNLIINSFTAAAYDIGYVYRAIPNVIGAALISAVNVVIRSVNTMVAKAIEPINELINSVNSSLPEWVKKNIGTLGTLSANPAKEVDNTFLTELAKATTERNSAIAAIMGSDPIGDFFGAVSSRAIANEAGGVTEQAKGAKELANRWREVGTSVKAANDNLREASYLANSFVSDIKQGLMDGKSLWDSFGAAATRALDQIANKALEMATNQLIAGIFGAALGGGGGNIAGYFGSSGYTNMLSFGGPRANGGPVRGGTPYLVGERGPELFVPSASGQVVSNQNMAGMGGNVINIDARGAQAGVGEEIRRALAEYDRQSYSRHVNNQQRASKRRAV